MEDVAQGMEQEDRHNSSETVRHNLLTWGRRVAIYAGSTSKQNGPKDAEKLPRAKGGGIGLWV
jgi:hypothetical protein